MSETPAQREADSTEKFLLAGYAYVLAVVVVAGLALAPAAVSHGPVGGGVGYVSSISGLDPNVLGVVVNVLGGDDRLQLVNYSGKTIVVLGYDGEPFLRFSADGVYENVRSPTTYLSRERDPEQARVPVSADPKAPPVWRKATGGSTFGWHDHRIHWTGHDLPPVVQQAPDEIHLIFKWRVPALADGKRFAIEGFLGYRPVETTPSGGGTDWWALAIAIGGAALVAGTIGAGTRRAWRRVP